MTINDKSKEKQRQLLEAELFNAVFILFFKGPRENGVALLD